MRIRTKNRQWPEASSDEGDMRYMLVGFTAGPNIYYVRQRQGSGLGRWWRFTYLSSEGCVVRQVIEETALREAGKGRDALLVYATEAALEESPNPLPQELETFVDQDNERFQQELAEESASSWQTLPEAPIEPIGGWNDEDTQYADAGNTGLRRQSFDAPAYEAPARQGYYPNNLHSHSGASSRTLTPNEGAEMQELGVVLPKETQATISQFLKNAGYPNSRTPENGTAAGGSDVFMEDSPEDGSRHIEDVDNGKKEDTEMGEGEGKEKGAEKYGSNNPYKPIVERESLL